MVTYEVLLIAKHKTLRKEQPFYFFEQIHANYKVLVKEQYQEFYSWLPLGKDWKSFGLQLSINA